MSIAATTPPTTGLPNDAVAAAPAPSASAPSAPELVEAVAPTRRASAPTSAAVPERLRRLDSPIGRIELTADEHGITSLVIERAGILPHDGREASTSPLLDAAARQLEEYFEGRRRSFDLALSRGGTAFQRAVWSRLDALDWGEVTSYGAIARATGRPAAGRAVGGAIGANPVPIIVGCHRVLAGDGRITGYSGGEGVPTKIWLLDHEQIPHA